MSLTPRLDNLEVNKIINGGLDIWQRGTSRSMTSNDQFYLADRFKAQSLNNATVITTVQRSTDVPNLDAQYSLQFDVTTAEVTLPAAGLYRIRYAVEGYDIQSLNGSKSCLSFWVKSAQTGTYYVVITNGGSTRRYTSSYTISVANTWEQKHITIDTLNLGIGTWDTVNGVGFDIFFVLGTGTTAVGAPTMNTWENGGFLIGSGQVNVASSTSNNFWITQVQLTKGDNQPTTFARAGRSVADELLACQRYFEKTYALGTFATAVTSVGQESWAQATAAVNFFSYRRYNVPKRTSSSTVTFYNPTTGGSGTWRDSSGNNLVTSLTGQSEFGFSESSVTAVAASLINGHWTSDADY